MGETHWPNWCRPTKASVLGVARIGGFSGTMGVMGCAVGWSTCWGACWGTFFGSIGGAIIGGMIKEWHGAVLGSLVGAVGGMFIGFLVAAYWGMKSNRQVSASVAPEPVYSQPEPRTMLGIVPSQSRAKIPSKKALSRTNSPRKAFQTPRHSMKEEARHIRKPVTIRAHTGTETKTPPPPPLPPLPAKKLRPKAPPGTAGIKSQQQPLAAGRAAVKEEQLEMRTDVVPRTKTPRTRTPRKNRQTKLRPPPLPHPK